MSPIFRNDNCYCNCNDEPTVSDLPKSLSTLSGPLVLLIVLNAMASRWPRNGHLGFPHREFILLRRNLRRHGAFTRRYSPRELARKGKFKKRHAIISQSGASIDL